MTFFKPVSPKNITPAEFCAFQHGSFWGSYLFAYWSSYFRTQNPLAADFESALFPMQLSPRFFLRIYVFCHAGNGGTYLYSGRLRLRFARLSSSSSIRISMIKRLPLSAILLLSVGRTHLIFMSFPKMSARNSSSRSGTVSGFMISLEKTSYKTFIPVSGKIVFSALF